MARYNPYETVYGTLEEALSSRTLDELKPLAKLVAGGSPARRDACVAAIMAALSGDGLWLLWEKMDPLLRAAVSEVVHGKDQRFDAAKFLSKYGDLPLRHHRDYYDRSKEIPWTLYDLLFTNDCLPFDLKNRLRAYAPPPPRAEIVAEEGPPPPVLQKPLFSWEARAGKKVSEAAVTVCETAEPALHDLTAVLRLVDAGRVGVSATTLKPTLASVRAICAVLLDGEFNEGRDAEVTGRAEDSIRAFAWPLLVQAAGLAGLSGTKLALTGAGRSALAGPTHETVRQLWKSWLKRGVIDEFSRIEAIKGQTRRKGRGVLTPPAGRRTAVQQALAECPAGKWIHIDEFFRFVRASGADFEVANDLWNLHIIDANYGSLGHGGYHGWNLVQGRYVMALLWEYAATPGLLDIAHVSPIAARNDYWDNWGGDQLDYLSRYDGLVWFRINALGAYCLGITGDYAPAARPARPALKILPNRDIVVHDAALFSPADALFLGQIAVKSGDHTWALDKGRILDALEGGTSVDAICAFLDGASQTPMPDNVRLFLTDTAQRAGQVLHEGPAELFHVADSATALLILHDTAAKALCFPAGPDRLAVPLRHVAAFRRALRQMGFAAPAKRAEGEGAAQKTGRKRGRKPSK